MTAQYKMLYLMSARCGCPPRPLPALGPGDGEQAADAVTTGIVQASAEFHPDHARLPAPGSSLRTTHAGGAGNALAAGLLTSGKADCPGNRASLDPKARISARFANEPKRGRANNGSEKYRDNLGWTPTLSAQVV